MKKKFKYFLLGAGTVVAGFFAYAWLKDQPKTRPVDDIIGESSADTIPQGASAEQNVSQEYIEHRRELYRKRAAQRAASPAVAEDSSASPVVACETPAARPENDSSSPTGTSGEGTASYETKHDDVDEGADVAGEGGDTDEALNDNKGQKETEDAHKE